MKNSWKLSMFALAIVLLSLTACSKKEASAPVAPDRTTENIPSQTKNLLETIQAAGKIRVGTEGTYAPFTFHDENGKLTGFDVEIAQEVAKPKRLGVQIEFMETNGDGLFGGLDTQQFDVVVNEIAIRDDLKEKYDFSDPYVISKAELIVHQDNRDIKKLADLKGKKAGQSLQSDLTDIARANGAAIVPTEGFSQSIDLLTSNKMDVVINNGLFYLNLKTKNPDAPIKVVGGTVSSWNSGILVNKGNQELLNAINQALTDLKSDGTYLKISKKYFGRDVSH